MSCDAILNAQRVDKLLGDGYFRSVSVSACLSWIIRLRAGDGRFLYFVAKDFWTSKGFFDSCSSIDGLKCCFVGWIWGVFVRPGDENGIEHDGKEDVFLNV
jgi:hypothetical protein